MIFRLVCLLLMGLSSVCAAQTPPDCKPVEHYGVKGCAIRPDRTCPDGYHQEAVGPPNPRMAGPTFLMCVPDTPPSKEDKSKEDKSNQHKPDSPEKSNR